MPGCQAWLPPPDPLGTSRGYKDHEGRRTEDSDGRLGRALDVGVPTPALPRGQLERFMVVKEVGYSLSSCGAFVTVTGLS